MPLFGPPNIEKLKAKDNIKGLIKALQYQKDEFVRSKAAGALGQIGAHEAVEPLIAALKDKSRDVRKAAAGALAQIGDPAAVDPLIAALDDVNEAVRIQAAQALARIGDARAVDALSALLNDRDVKIREEAAKAMYDLGWRPKRDRVSAAYWIARGNWGECVGIGSAASEAVSYALARFTEQRQQAIDALGRIGDTRAIQTLIAQAERDKPAAERARQALAKIGPAAIAPLLKSQDSTKGRGELEIIAQMGIQAVGPLIDILSEGDPKTSPVAMGALERIGDQRAVEPIIALLDHGDWFVRNRAIAALSRLKGERAVDALCAELGNKESANRRYIIAQALGEIGHVKAIEPLTRALEDTDPDIRRSAASSLGQIRSPHAIEPLLASLDDPDSTVIAAAASALAEIYYRGALSQEEKQAILAQKSTLLKYAHSDQGIDCHHSDRTHYQTDFLL